MHQIRLVVAQGDPPKGQFSYRARSADRPVSRQKRVVPVAHDITLANHGGPPRVLLSRPWLNRLRTFSAGQVMPLALVQPHPLGYQVYLEETDEQHTPCGSADLRRSSRGMSGQTSYTINLTLPATSDYSDRPC